MVYGIASSRRQQPPASVQQSRRVCLSKMTSEILLLALYFQHSHLIQFQALSDTVWKIAPLSAENDNTVKFST